MHDIIIVIINKAISFAGTVDPLEGTASAEVMHNFRRGSAPYHWPRMASAAENGEK